MQSVSSIKNLYRDLWMINNQHKHVVDTRLNFISHYKDEIRSQIILKSFQQLMFTNADKFKSILQEHGDYFQHL